MPGSLVLDLFTNRDFEFSASASDSLTSMEVSLVIRSIGVVFMGKGRISNADAIDHVSSGFLYA